MSDIFDHEGDAIDDLLFREDRPEYRAYKPFKVCSRCNTGGLRWRQFAEKWKLVNSNGQQHCCPPLPSRVRY